MKGFLFFLTLKKNGFQKVRTPLLEIPDRIDLLWPLEFQSDISKIASATKTFKMWSKQPSIVVGVCNRDGFLRVSLATDIQVTQGDPGGISQAKGEEMKPMKASSTGL